MSNNRISDRTSNIRFIDRLDQGKLSRREFTQALSALGLVTAAIPFTGQQARAAAGEIDYITWSGYEEPVFWQEYIDKHGTTVNHTFQNDEQEALVKVMAGFTADLTHPCTHISRKYLDSGILQPIDSSRLSRWKDVFPDLRNANGVAHEGNDILFMPFEWGTSTVLYRTDLIDPKYIEEESWEVIFDERYKGKLAAYSADSSVVVAGLVLGYENIWSMTDEQLVHVRELMKKQSELVRFYWEDVASVEQALAAGEIVATYGWASSYMMLKGEGVPVKLMLNPKEGVLTWICGPSWTTVGDADESLIYDFLDAMLSPDAGKVMIDQFGYGHSNQKSFEIASKEVVQDLFGDDILAALKKGWVFSPMSGEIHDKYYEVLEGVKAEAGL